MESRVGLEYIVEHGEYAGKLAAALASPSAPVKRQVFELLSALCVYNADGYARALDTLQHYMKLKNTRYRLSIIVHELERAVQPEYQTALMAFVNCLIISAPRLPDRIRIRNEFIGLNLLPVLNKLRHEVANHPDLGVQLDVFEEQRESDEAQGPGGINLNSHQDVFFAILNRVTDTGQDIPFLSILQHLLKIDPKEPVSDVIWDTAETLVNRATLLETKEDAAKLLRSPSVQTKFGCASCQHRSDSLCSGGPRKPSLRALSPPPPPPPPLAAPAAVHAPPPPPPPGPPPPPPPLVTPSSTNAARTPAPAPAPDIKLPQQETPLPKTKMKTINWNKIPNNKVIGKNNIWSIVALSHKHSPKSELDWSEIEGLFCQQIQPTSASSSPRLGRAGVAGGIAGEAGERRPRKESSEITLLDGKRSLNVNIFLKQFRSSNEDIIQLICEGAHEDIGSEKLRGLLKILPELDEIEMLKSFNGDVSRLGNAEKFLLQLIQLPHYKLRIESMLLKEEFAGTSGCLESSINAMLEAGDDLASSRALQEVLYIALIAGNFLNAGGYAGGAAGVKLSSLQKLTDIRANKPGMNLMHYIAMQAEKKHPDLIKFADDLRVLEDAAKTSVEQLNNEIKALDSRIVVINNQVQLPSTDKEIKAQMTEFLVSAQREVTALKKDMEEVENTRKLLADFFCEDPVSFKLEECFKVMAAFCSKFRTAAMENVRRRANEEQAAARRRARDASRLHSPRPGGGGGSNGSCVGTPTSESESLMECLLVDIRAGFGRRSLRRTGPDSATGSPVPARRTLSGNDEQPSPDVTPTGSLRRRARAPGDDEGGLLEFLRMSGDGSGGAARDRKSWGSLDRSWSRRGGPVRARLEIPTPERERERTASPAPLAPANPANAAHPSHAAALEREDQQSNNQNANKPKEWRQKIESWLRANNQEDRQSEELRARARRLHNNRRSLENDSESERSTLDTLHEDKLVGSTEVLNTATSPRLSSDWRPSSVLDKDVVGAMEAVEDVQPQAKDTKVPWRKSDDNEDLRRLRRQRSRQSIDNIQNTLMAIKEEDKRKHAPDPVPNIASSTPASKVPWISKFNSESVNTVTSSSKKPEPSNKVEIDSDNIETPPVTRKLFNPPPEKEPCRRFQSSVNNRLTNTLDRSNPDMKELCQEILGDGQFDRFSAARRTRRYKRTTDSSSQDEESTPAKVSETVVRQPIEILAEKQKLRPSKLEIQSSYPIDVVAPVKTSSIINETVEEKENRLKKWQDRLKDITSPENKPTPPLFNSPPKQSTSSDSKNIRMMRRQTSINQEDVQKAIRELKSPTEKPTGVWPRGSYRYRLEQSKPNNTTHTTSIDKTTVNTLQPARVTKTKSEHELNDEGFEETQSLNSESASQGASSGCNMECDILDTSVVRKKTLPMRGVKSTPPRVPISTEKRSVIPRRNISNRVERSASRSSLRSSRSSLNSAVSVATVRRAPAAPVRPAPKVVAPKAVARTPRPASRSSSSGSSVGARPSGLVSKVTPTSRSVGFMRPTQASRVRTHVTTTPRLVK